MKRSIIWSVDKDKMKQIVADSNSISVILNYFGLKHKGGNYKTLKKRLLEEKINYSHIALGIGSNKGRKFGDRKKIPLNEILVENSTYTNRGYLKKRLIDEGIFEYKCDECGNKGMWNKKSLSLTLDHRNGIDNDNRKENLRFLCPNCHSQTNTFCGKRFKKPIEKCKKCGDSRGRRSKTGLCQKCFNKKLNFENRKIKNRPSKSILRKMTKEHGYVETGRRFGVSDNTIRKWLQ